MQPTERQGTEASWRRYWRVLIGVIGAELTVAALLILVGNPYGNLPHVVFRSHVIMDSNQRYQYPAIVRSGRADSIVIGTSTSRLLRPAALEELFGGHFANLAMDAGTAWEQYRLAQFFLTHTPHPRTLLIGIDAVWCASDADRAKVTKRGFPEWMFDDDPWNDLPWMLNKTSAEIAGRRIATALGLNRERIASDGYEVFTPAEARYDLAKVERELYGAGGAAPAPLAASAVAYEPSPAERAGWRFPALEWLADVLAHSARWQRIVLVFPPPHVTGMPVAGSRGAAREAECKARITQLAQASGVAVVDFRFPSPISREARNYWDKLHYRVGIAERLVTDIGRALGEGRDDPAGDWKLLAGAAVAASAEQSASIGATGMRP